MGSFFLLGTTRFLRLGKILVLGSGFIPTLFVFGLEPPKKPPKNAVFLRVLGSGFTMFGTLFPTPTFTFWGAAGTFPPKNFGLLPLIKILPLGNEIRVLG